MLQEQQPQLLHPAQPEIGDQVLSAVHALYQEFRHLQNDTRTRLETLERQRPIAQAPYQATNLGISAPHIGYTSQPVPGGSSNQPAGEPIRDLQADYTALKDSLSRIRLDTQFRLNDTRTGKRREDQPVFNLLVRSARYVETQIKILQQIQHARETTPSDLQNLSLISLAHIAALQDEYSALVVQGTCNKDVASCSAHSARTLLDYRPMLSAIYATHPKWLPL